MNRTTHFATRFAAIAVVSGVAASSAHAAFTIGALSTFGGGDGWRAPNEIVTGDTAGTATGSNYNYLQGGSLERGLAYNPTTGNLVLVSRSTAGNGIRLLNGTSGADVGSLNQGTGIIAGGTFATNMVGVAGDGAIYVGNLAAATATNNLKIYRWSSETASAPTVFANATPVSSVAGRLGDSLDVTGSGTSTRIVAGYSGTTGYARYDDTGAQTNFSPIAGTGAGDFRLGITFAGSADKVWGKQTGAANNLRRATLSSLDGSNVLTSAGEAPMDYISLAGHAFLATIDVNSSVVRVYNADDASSLVLLGSATTTSGTLIANGNATGALAFGAASALDYDNATATLYAMSTNQGIQAFTLNLPIPEPTSLAALGLVGLLGSRRRK